MVSSARFSVWLLGGIAVLAWLSFLTGTATADRQATAAESRGMWRAVDREVHLDGCVERRGHISTAGTPRRKFGTVVIADSHCGNGQFVWPRGEAPRALGGSSAPAATGAVPTAVPTTCAHPPAGARRLLRSRLLRRSLTPLARLGERRG